MIRTTFGERMPEAGPFVPDEMRLLLEAVVGRDPTGVAVLDLPEMRCIFCNPAYRRLAPGGEILGRTISEVWGDTPTGAPFERVMVGETPYLLHFLTGAAERAAQLEELHATEILLAATDSMSSLEVDEVIQTGIEAMLQATQCRSVSAMLLDHERGQVTFRGLGGAGPSPAAAHVPVSDLPPETRAMLEERHTAILDMDDPSTSEAARAWATEENACYVLMLPMLAVDHLLGALIVHDPGNRHEFTRRELELAEAIASEAAIALENAELYEAKCEAARLNERLADIDVTLHSTLEASEIITQAIHAGGAALGADSGLLSFHEGDAFRVGYAYGMGSGIVGELMPVGREQHSVLALETRDVVVIEDAAVDPRCTSGHLTAHGVRALVACPLIVRDEPVANVYFNYSEPHRFSAAEVEFTRRLGSSLALALQNAQAYEAEHRIAHTLQEALLTLPAEIPGVSIEHVYESAAHATRVGGDFYDVFELEHGHLGVVIGDVSGKGLDAAVLTALVKNTIRAHAVIKGNTPSHVMDIVNQVLLKESRPETFVTAFFGMLDRRDGRLVYCNAAHPPPIILGTDGHAARLAANSPIAGAFPGAAFEDSESYVGISELLFLYTDGLTEARRSGQLYGEERLFVQLAGEADTDPQRAIRRVVDDAVAFAGGKLSDDLAVLAIRRQPLPSRIPVQQKLPLWAGMA